MRGLLSTTACSVAVTILLSPVFPGVFISASAKDGISPVLKQQESYILSLELEFSKKNQAHFKERSRFLIGEPMGMQLVSWSGRE